MTPYDTGEAKDIPEDQTSSVSAATQRPNRKEAEAAVELLLRWIGDDPAREGLVGTPERVVRAWEEFCICLLYTSPSPRDISGSRMPSSA